MSFVLPDYLKVKGSKITPMMRSVLIDWMVEIQENFENYVDKKDTTWSCLEGLKAHAKLVSLGESMDRDMVNMETDQVELCRFLYKLHFQQLLLLERRQTNGCRTARAREGNHRGGRARPHPEARSSRTL